VNFTWSLFIDLGIISAALLAATYIRARIPFFQRYLIPNALTAGFVLLPLYNFVLPHIGVTSSGLGELAYHLLSISFVAMALRKAPHAGKKGDNRIFATSVAVLSQYALQAFLGLIATFIIMSTFMPQLYEPFGFLLPLGFVLGPGQAFAIGEGWSSFGIEGAGSVGLTFAALGYIISAFGGVFLINYGIRKEWLKPEFRKLFEKSGIRTGVYGRNEERPVGSRLTTETEAIDSMTFNTGIVLVCYFLAYLFLSGITELLSALGDAGRELAVNLWGISFIFAALIGLLVKHTMQFLRVEYVLDNHTLTRVSGISVDVMVTSAIAAISLVLVSEYIVPIAILALVAGSLVFLTVPWLSSRLFTDHRFHRMLLVFGVSTGTLSTGLALLRVVDPDFETPVASDYAYASGITFVLAIPFILSINLPVRAFVTGDPLYFWLAVGVSLAYLAFVSVSFLLLSRGRVFHRPTKVWLRESET
jgi:ESS family glutamate:Na+ symporter